jgi:Glycosyl hydrolases family 2, sugar binding domain/Glycosyl hydrolases family 2, TIM barrel domain
MKRIFVLSAVIFTALLAQAYPTALPQFLPADETLSLAGRWRFQLDRADEGIGKNWATNKLSSHIHLPGSLPAQGIGDDVTTNTVWTGGIVDRSFFTAPEFAQYRQPGHVKLPFWLTPEKYYAGVAWYQRDFSLPKNWRGKRVVLTLERPHWETRVWVDGKIFGTNDSLGTPHEYDLGQLAPGAHTLTVRVDNRRIVDVGENSHSISDHTQGNWNGIAGDLSLRATPLVWIEDLQVWPHIATKSATVTGKIGNRTNADGKGGVIFYVNGKLVGAAEVFWTADGGEFRSEVALGDDAPLWDEFHPAVLHLTAKLGDAVCRTQFGLREIGTQGTQFTVNGRKTFFRGTLECCVFPRTGHPPTDIAEWKHILGVAKSYGLNLLRFHSWCPPEAAFQVADELGFYFQVEAGSWANQSTTIGDGKPVDAWVYAETERILKTYGNHPSFVLMPYGNEPGGENFQKYLAGYVEHFKAEDSRRLWTSASGWPELAENQFDVTPKPRIQGWGDGLKSRLNALPPETTTDYRDFIGQRTVPVISHEIGEWCVYPNFSEMGKYDGYLQPKNFEIFRDSLNAHHLGDQAEWFLYASGKLQTLCYKEEIESALRTPGMGGFELLGLTDFPGQGTALVGVLDPFWETKGYVNAAQFSRFCNPVVPLARLPKRVFTADERLTADLEAANFSAAPLTNATAYCRLVAADGRVLAEQIFDQRTLPVDNGLALGKVNFSLKNVPAPARCKLVAGLSGTRFQNDWDVWIYPPATAPKNPPTVNVFHELNDAALAVLDSGGTVLWLVPPQNVRNDQKVPMKLGFSSIFWNTAWTHRQAPTTLGILCDARAPLFAEFPTENFSNWQWWYLIRHAQPLLLDGLPAALLPAVQVIDDWTTNRKLGLAFEAKARHGKIFVCSVDLENDLDTDPVRRQFRASLLDYLAGEKFQPEIAVDTAVLQKLAVVQP